MLGLSIGRLCSSKRSRFSFSNVLGVASSTLDNGNDVINVACHVALCVSDFTRCCKRVRGLSVSNVLTSKAVKSTAVRTGWSGSIIMIKGFRRESSLSMSYIGAF